MSQQGLSYLISAIYFIKQEYPIRSLDNESRLVKMIWYYIEKNPPQKIAYKG